MSKLLTPEVLAELKDRLHHDSNSLSLGEQLALIAAAEREQAIKALLEITVLAAQPLVEEVERLRANHKAVWDGAEQLSREREGFERRMETAERHRDTLVSVIERVLDDEESGLRPDGTLGWGPDVTAVGWLKEALASVKEGK